MKLIKGTVLVFLSLIACAFLVTDFSDNLKAAYDEDEGAGLESQEYSWEDFKAALGLDLGGKNLTELSLADFSAQQQAELKPYLEGKPIQEWTANFCNQFGSADYYGMTVTVEDSNPDKNLAPLFMLWETIAVNYCK